MSKKYAVVSHYNPKKFTALITKALENGWKLQGGVALIQSQHPTKKTPLFLYAQALTN